MKPIPYAVNEATWRANHRKDLVLSRAVRVLADPEREKRREAGLCLSCCYVREPRLAGQAFTGWACRICEQPQGHHPNTAVPLLCLECAHKFGLCVECMADDELRPRRKINVVRRVKRKRAPVQPRTAREDGNG